MVTGSQAEVWPLHQELRPAAQHGRVICMPLHKTHHHELFVQSLLRKVSRCMYRDGIQITFCTYNFLTPHIEEDGDIVTIS